MRKQVDIASLAERTLLDAHTPPAMIIEANGDIRYIHGRMHKYLEHAQGPVRSYNAFEMARPGLKIHLIATLRKMRPDSAGIGQEVRIDQDGHTLDVRVTISPMPQEAARGLYLVVFEELAAEKKHKHPKAAAGRSQEDLAAWNQELGEELKTTRNKLRTTVEALESANEELRSANEEYQSTNEELQSANEELNSSKEELQSLNEELETVNSELQGKVRQVEQEVKTTEGSVYLMRVLPYRYLSNQRLGTVLTFVNIKDLKGMAQQLQFVEDAWRFAEGIVGTVRHPLVVLDPSMKIISANESFYRLFQLSGKAVVAGRSFNDLGTGQLDIPELRKVLEDVLPKSQSFEDLEIECEFPEIGRQKFRLNARRIYERGIAKDRILLAMEQVAEKE